MNGTHSRTHANGFTSIYISIYCTWVFVPRRNTSSLTFYTQFLCKYRLRSLEQRRLILNVQRKIISLLDVVSLLWWCSTFEMTVNGSPLLNTPTDIENSERTDEYRIVLKLNQSFSIYSFNAFQFQSVSFQFSVLVRSLEHTSLWPLSTWSIFSM